MLGSLLIKTVEKLDNGRRGYIKPGTGAKRIYVEQLVVREAIEREAENVTLTRNTQTVDKAVKENRKIRQMSPS